MSATKSASEAGSDGLRARKKRHVRRTIRDAALTLFVEHGYEAVGVEQIAAAADVSRATFFNYFSSKEATITAPDPEEVAAWAEILERHTDTEPLWEALCAVVLDGFRASENSLMAQKRIKASSPTISDVFMRSSEWIERDLAAWVVARTPVSERNRARLQLNVAMAALRTAWDEWADEPLAVLIDRAQSHLDAVAVGMCPPGHACS